jgi:hypothetical protein
VQLGAFSVSLNVKDIAASTAFYEKLGFTRFAGDIAQNWLILKNGQAVVGLFQGMLERNAMTFNPGWDQDARPLNPSRTCATSSANCRARVSVSPAKRRKEQPGRRASLLLIRTATR